MSRWYLYFIALILLAIVYSFGVFSRSIWYDEAITLQSNAVADYVQPAAGPLVAAEVQRLFAGVRTLPQLIDGYIENDVHPPLYFGVANAATWVFGNSLTVMRFVSLALVLGSVALFARLMARFEPPNAMAYVLTYGLSFSVATSAHDARGYAMVLFLAVLAWLTAAPRDNDDDPRPVLWRVVVNGLACGGLLLTHYFAVFIVVPLLGVQVLRGLVTRRFLYWLSPLVAFLVFLPWLPVMLHHMGARPDQMTGFPGLVGWVKEMLAFLPGQVFSATSFDVPNVAQRLGRLACFALIGLGMLQVLLWNTAALRRWSHANIALFVVVVGVGLFFVAALLMDRSFNALRYWTFFTPFLAYLAARGALMLGQGIARAIPAVPRQAPVWLLVAGLAAMLNFGFETNRNRGGGFYRSIAAEVAQAGTDQSLIVADPGVGRGATLAVAYEVAPDQMLYLLPRDPTEWGASARALEPLLDNRSTVILAFTIDRGSMNADKTALYGDFVALFERLGYQRAPIIATAQDGRHYAKWTR